MDERKILSTILDEFYEKLKTIQNILPRTAQFPEAKNKIKVVIGMRRSGKTYFIYQKILKLLEKDVPLNRILYINFEDDRLLPLE